MISEIVPKTPEDQIVQFGMLYEKYVFSKIVKELVSKYKIKSVCEFPYNELMGKDNNQFFKKNGCEITRYRQFNETNQNEYDLVWNFCEYENCSSSEYIVSKMKSLSKKYLLIITQNMYNVMMLHYWYHVYKMRQWDHGKITKMNYIACKKDFKKQNIRVLEIGAFDVPWFVLDFYEGGEFFRGLAPKNMINTEVEIKESYFEKLPGPLRILLAHHHYILGKK